MTLDESLFLGDILGKERYEMKHLSQNELAGRWNIKPHTLENMRWRKVGPPYIKIGGKVMYRLEDIETYERAHLFLENKSLVSA
jgi:hypothetical protein